MYALTIAKGGLNKAKMTAPIPGDCMPIAEYSAAVAAGKVSPSKLPRICGRMFSSLDNGMEFSSFTLQQLAKFMSTDMEHFVLDHTGVEATFNFVLKPERGPGGLSLDFSRTLAELGLKLEPTKGPAEYLVIDRAERPAPDSPAPDSPPARAVGAGPR
jgi:uncharacterized protein (TIGR03435 family)